MAERRTLADRIKTPSPSVDPQKEKEFVYQPKAAAKPESPEPAQSPSAPTAGNAQARVPLSTRMRADLFAALKRASLERQLAGQEPHTVMDIVEQAVEPWLRKNGYLR